MCKGIPPPGKHPGGTGGFQIKLRMGPIDSPAHRAHRFRILNLGLHLNKLRQYLEGGSRSGNKSVMHGCTVQWGGDSSANKATPAQSAGLGSATGESGKNFAAAGITSLALRLLLLPSHSGARAASAIASALGKMPFPLLSTKCTRSKVPRSGM